MMETENERNIPLTFPKSERLRLRSLVDALFAEGESMYEYPLRMTWRPVSNAMLDSCFRGETPRGIAPVQMMVTVPKKKRRHAVDRVRMRRVVREAYRLHRRDLRAVVESIPEIRTLSIAFIYIATENVPYAKVEKKIMSLLGKLAARISASSGNEPTYDEIPSCE